MKGGMKLKKKKTVDVVHHEGVCIEKLMVSHIVNKFSTFNITTIYYHFYKTSLSLISIVYVPHPQCVRNLASSTGKKVKFLMSTP
jgi:hypothetical protein